MSKKKKKLKKVINSAVVDALEKMKTLKAEDRFQLLLEMGEWIYTPIDLEEELLVPNFDKEVL